MDSCGLLLFELRSSVLNALLRHMTSLFASSLVQLATLLQRFQGSLDFEGYALVISRRIVQLTCCAAKEKLHVF